MHNLKQARYSRLLIKRELMYTKDPAARSNLIDALDVLDKAWPTAFMPTDHAQG